LSLYIFFWNAKHLPVEYKKWNLRDPLRVAFITNPRDFVYRIYYNQATSVGDGKLKLVNWFDGNNLGLNREPLLPDIKTVYRNFDGRHFVVPVVHVMRPPPHVGWLLSNLLLFQNPPWIFITNLNNRSSISVDNDDSDDEIDDGRNVTEGVTVGFQVSGRDDTLLKILASKMNFQFEYVDALSLAEMESYENVTQNSALGVEMLRRRVNWMRGHFYNFLFDFYL
jgi:hypothetical protein